MLDVGGVKVALIRVDREASQGSRQHKRKHFALT